MSYSLEFDLKGFEFLVSRAPDILAKNLRQAILRSLQEMARTARRLAPKAESVMTNAITVRMENSISGVVAAGTNYARMVEEGTGPGGFPSQQSMLDWLKVKGIQPRDPEMTIEDLAFVVARSIARKGTQEQPFLSTAFEVHADTTFSRIDTAIQKTIQQWGQA